MAIVMKQFIDRFKAMEKIANETLSADPEALAGVDSLPGAEHDAKVPADAKKPDEEVAQGQPAGATSTDGATVGGDAKPLNEGKLEMDQALLNPEQKPLISDDALTAKVANDQLASLVGDLLSDLKKAPAREPAEKSAKVNSPRQIRLDDDTIAKIAAAQATFMMGKEAADNIVKRMAKTAAPAMDARALIKDACIKAAQADGLNPEEAAAAADNAMAAAGLAPAEAAPVADAAATADAAVPADAAAAAADAGAADAAAADATADAAAADAGAAEAAADIPEDVTEEELATAIVDLVESGELDADTAKALVEEIAGDAGDAGDAGAAPTEDQAAEIIADGLQSGEITPEQAEAIAAAVEGEAGAAAPADAAVADADEAQGAADAEAAIQDAADEAQGAADAEAAMKSAAEHIRANAIAKVASAVVAKRNEKKAAAQPRPGQRILAKVAGIIEAKQAQKQATATDGKDAKYIAGFKKKAEEMGVDPSALAKYICDRTAK